MQSKEEKRLINDNYVSEIKQEELIIKDENEDEDYDDNDYSSFEIKQENNEEIVLKSYSTVNGFKNERVIVSNHIDELLPDIRRKSSFKNHAMSSNESVGTPLKKKTTMEQLNYFADFLNENRILLHGKTKPLEADNIVIDKLWDELTATLNSLGCGPSKTKVQWKKTFTDWKSYTKKKARELTKVKQKIGGGESEAKKLTPAEEKLMSALTAKEVDVMQVGLGNENEDVKSGIVPELLANRSIFAFEKRIAEPIYGENKKPRLEEKSSQLQKGAEVYPLGKKHLADLLQQMISTCKPSSQSNVFRAKELELKEMELRVRIMEAKNKEKELALKERELNIREQELNKI